ncbi:MAG: DEAD/DEAH box helicase [Candidatus Nanoarchaeia archaeon]|nr:DEAD/DEAH box helicase [Candidatus Nanoarchaeia archaeon]
MENKEENKGKVLKPIIEYKNKMPENIFSIVEQMGFSNFNPPQYKSIDENLFEGNFLICSPTGSGKTLVAELKFLDMILNKNKKVVYIVPLKALAQEKYKSFKKKYPQIKTSISIGDVDSKEDYLLNFDLIITTSEKMDSLIRHKSLFIFELGLIVIDEIHLINDYTRGPVLEVVITFLRTFLKEINIIGLSATIGNPKELADWLKSRLIIDDYRPVELKKGVLIDGEIKFY